MPKTFTNGEVLWQYPDTPTDVIFGGSSVLTFQPISILVRPDGSGVLNTRLSLDTAGVDGAGNRYRGLGKKLLDGTYRTYTYYGQVQVIP